MIIAGIGSRKISNTEKRKIYSFTSEFMKRFPMSWVRSGHASGADYCFEEASKGRCVVYLPYKDFNKSMPLLTSHVLSIEDVSKSSKMKAFQSVYKHHPNPRSLSQSVMNFHMRNYFQICGARGKKNVDAVVFSAPTGDDGEVLGGTGQAIRIARSLDIPVYNILYDEHSSFFQDF